MPPSFKSLGDLFHHLYVTPGKSLVQYTKMLEYNARQMFERSTISGQLYRAQTLRRILDRHLSATTKNDDEVDEVLELHNLLSECFDVVTDDLLLLSAFEIFAKSKILRRQYVIHEIEKPDDLATRQRKQPIHVRAVRAQAKKGNAIIFKKFTIGINTLLKPRYRKLYPYTPSIKKGLEEIRLRRNQVHFPDAFGWTVTKEVLSVVKYLEREIPPFKN